MRTRIAWLALTVLLVFVAAACQSQPDPGPSEVAAETPRGFTLFATDTPTPTPTNTPTATPTATPTSTATPTATATPLAASAAGRAPIGRVVFGVTRGDEPAEQLWLLDERDGLTVMAESVRPDGWQCSTAPPGSCALVTGDGYLLAGNPVSQTAVLLDQLTVAGASTPTLAGPDATPIVLALSSNGQSLAVALPDRLDLYDLLSPALQASIAVTGVTELAWSPDGTMLALVYPVGDARALALWSGEGEQVRVVAQSDGVQHAVWSPDSEKIAFDAYQSPATPSSQGGQTDVFVVFLRSGEIANFSEVFLRNAGVAAASRVAAWSPQWQSADVLRYVRGVPDASDTHTVMRHAVRSRQATQLWPVDEEGLLGVATSSDGAFDARAVSVDGRAVVQVSPSGSQEWRDLPGAYDHLSAISWAPPAGGDEAMRYLLLVQNDNLLTVEVASGAIQGLALACPQCSITRAVWLP